MWWRLELRLFLHSTDLSLAHEDHAVRHGALDPAGESECSSPDGAVLSRYSRSRRPLPLHCPDTSGERQGSNGVTRATAAERLCPLRYLADARTTIAVRKASRLLCLLGLSPERRHQPVHNLHTV